MEPTTTGGDTMNEINTTGHGPGCPSPVGGDCDCRVEHDMECPARHRVYDVTDCTCGKTAEFMAARFICKCGALAVATQAEANARTTTAAGVNVPVKCPSCHTIPTDHPFRGGDDSDFRCYDCDMRLGSHGAGPVWPEAKPEAPAEVWCSKCPEPTVALVDGVALCAFHYGVEVGTREGLRAAALAREPKSTARTSCGWSNPVCTKDAVGTFDRAYDNGRVYEIVTACADHAGRVLRLSDELAAIAATESENRALWGDR